MSYRLDKFTISATPPSETSIAWVDNTINDLGCHPVRFFINGDWSAQESSLWYDTIGQVLSNGRPYRLLTTGQSNPGGPYIDGWSDPGDPPYNGYYGDMEPHPLVSGWDFNTNEWTVAAPNIVPFASSSGANYVLLTAKKIAVETGRAVRIVAYFLGGTGLEHWGGNVADEVGAALGYTTLALRIGDSNMNKADLFIWGQGEAGMGGPGVITTSYYTKFLAYIDKMREDEFLRSDTFVLCSGTGDPAYGGASTNGVGGTGDGALRAVAASSDRYIDYVDVIGVETDGIHFTPLGHEEIARRMFTKLKQMPKDPTKNLLGYDEVAPWKILSNIQKLLATGLVLTKANGTPYLELGATDNIVSLKDPTAGTAGGNAGLTFNANTNSFALKDHQGNQLAASSDGYLIWGGALGFIAPVLRAQSGSTPTIELFDVTDKKWKIINATGAANAIIFLYDDIERFRISKTGQVRANLMVEYADNAAALLGGLITGDFYRTGDTLKIVHA